MRKAKNRKRRVRSFIEGALSASFALAWLLLVLSPLWIVAIPALAIASWLQGGESETRLAVATIASAFFFGGALSFYARLIPKEFPKLRSFAGYFLFGFGALALLATLTLPWWGLRLLKAAEAAGGREYNLPLLLSLVGAFAVAGAWKGAWDLLGEERESEESEG